MRCIYCVKIKLLEHCITARFPLFVFGCSFLIMIISKDKYSKNMYTMQKLRFKNKKMIYSYLIMFIAATIESNPASAILCLSAFIRKICLTYFVVGVGHTLGLISYSGSVNTKPS